MANSIGQKEKFIELLRTIFQFNKDRIDLDFGVYRIFKHKEEQINTFIDEELPKFLEDNLYGMNPYDVYNDILNFFSRYYENGDFYPAPVFSQEKHHILRHNGEEILFSWANKDQYYIKSVDSFLRYKIVEIESYQVTTDCPEVKSVQFVVNEIKEIKGNNKDKRVYKLSSKEPECTPDGDFIIYMDYKDGQRVSFEEINGILQENSIVVSNLSHHYEKYLNQGKTDFFIHKDLNEFLTMELDFYIKSHILKLDELTEEDFSPVQRAKAVKATAEKVISFLASLEDLQKLLWEKKKFAYDVNYLITLDKIPLYLLEELMSLDAFSTQISEWIALGMIESFDTESYKDVLGEVKDEYKFLPLDTKHFSSDFSIKYKLLESFEYLDAETNGLLIKSDNFHGLNYLQQRYREEVKCVYIDPPYNTGKNDFAYKDSYRNSSWLTMLENRIEQLYKLINPNGMFYCSIDDKDDTNRVTHHLSQVIEGIFGKNNYLDNLIWVKNTTHNDAKTFSHNHEYIQAYSKNRLLVEGNERMLRQSKPGYIEVMELIKELNPDYPTIEEIVEALTELYKGLTEQYKQEILAEGLEWNEETKKSNPYKGINNYKFAEYRDEDGLWVDSNEAEDKNAKIYVYREDNPSWPNASSLTHEHRDPSDPDYRFYTPTDSNGNQRPAPKSGWRWRQQPNPDNPKTLSFESLNANHMIHFGDNPDKIPQYKRFLYTVESDVVKSIIHDYTDGEKELANLLGERGTFSNPKPTTLIQKIVEMSSMEGDIIIDAFAGSGSTLQSVIKQNKVDEKDRRWIGLEMGEYFDKFTKKRCQKSIYTNNWGDGKAKDHNGISQLVKYYSLEQYEDTLENTVLTHGSNVEEYLTDLESLKEIMSDFYTKQFLSLYKDFSMNHSKSLLMGIENDLLNKPFDFILTIFEEGKPVEKTVDLVETFNTLYGLIVDRIMLKEFKENRYIFVNSSSTVVIWREFNVEDLESMQQEAFKTEEMDFIKENVDLDGKEVFMNAVSQTHTKNEFNAHETLFTLRELLIGSQGV